MITAEELVKLQRKAKMWDDLYEAVNECYEYNEETGDPIDNGSDLGTIGEIAAVHLGFL